MTKTVMTSVVLCGLVVWTVCRGQEGGDFQPNRTQRSPSAGSGLTPRNPTIDGKESGPQRETIRVTVPVVTTEYVDESTPNGVVKVPKRTINYEERQVPMPSAEETQRLRDELRELNGQKIDLLDSAELIEAVSRTKQEVEELQAWAKLMRIKAELQELRNTHAGTSAAQVAIDMLGRIPPQGPAALPVAVPSGEFAPVPVYDNGGSPYYPKPPAPVEPRATPGDDDVFRPADKK